MATYQVKLAQAEWLTDTILTASNSWDGYMYDYSERGLTAPPVTASPKTK